VYWATKQLRLPLIYTVHGWSFHIDQSFIVRKIRELSESFLTKKSNKVICVSNSNQQDGINRFQMINSRVIHNAVNIRKFNPDNKFEDIRGELGIPQNKVVIGYIVRFTAQKDPFTMLRAMKIVCDKTENVMLLMVGEGELKQKTIEMARELGIEKHIVFQDFRKDIPRILNSIDIYALPSLWEGFPIGILEAMAMKRAVIASAVDGSTELIKNGVNGILIEHSKPKQLADAIIKLSKNKKFMNVLGKNAYSYVRDNFTIKNLTSKVQLMYNVVNRVYNQNRA